MQERSISKSTLGLIAIAAGVAVVLAIAYMPLFQRPAQQDLPPTAPLQSGARAKTEAVVGEEVVFTGQAGFGRKPYQFEWLFPDGTTVRTQNATHIFTNPGDYTVLLRVSDSAGYERSNTLPIRILPDSE